VENPYEAPKSEVSDGRRSIDPQGPKIALWFYSAPLFGLAIAAMFFLRAMGILNENPEVRPGDLGVAMRSVMLAIIPFFGAGLIGYLWVFDSIFRHEGLGKGYFWRAVTLSACYCFLVFPFGLIGGGLLIVVLLVKRGSFFHLRSAGKEVERES